MNRREIAQGLWRFARPHRGRLLLAFACMTVLGLSTGAYAYLLGPALNFLLTGGHASLGVVARLAPSVLEVDRTRLLWTLPAIVVALGLIKGIAYLGQFYWMGQFGQRVVADLRRRIFEHLTGLSPIELTKQKTGDLLSRFSSDVAAVELAATYTVGSYVRDGLQIVILVGVAVSLEWRLALATLAILPIAVLPAARLTRSVLKRTREGQFELGELAAQIKEGLGGLKTVQAFNAQQAELRQFDARAATLQRAMIRAAWSRGAVPGVMEILAAGAIAAALAYEAATHTLQPDRLISVLGAVVLIYQPAKDLGRVSQFGLAATVAGERIFGLLALPASTIDAPDAKPCAPLSSAIRFEHVRHVYGDRPALEDLSLELPADKVTALVGESGGGKSTVASLLLRFQDPSSGTIDFDGVDVRSLTAASVRAQLALVTQEPLLFSDTVLENLRYGRPNASMDEVIAAATVANAEGFIRALPEGYQTRIGERGVILSGGQRQRLCLARAVLANARMLVLDEATSSLDPQSEREVQEALAKVLAGRGALVIAHRLSTIAAADRIHVLDGGRIVESGTHAELLQRGGKYARLWALQEGEPAREGAA